MFWKRPGRADMTSYTKDGVDNIVLNLQVSELDKEENMTLMEGLCN